MLPFDVKICRTVTQAANKLAETECTVRIMAVWAARPKCFTG